MRGGTANRWGEAIKLFDFLVAGAGSAGCVIARVLAEAGYRVAVIEAADPGPPTRRPAEYLQSFGTVQDWQLKTEPQQYLANRQLIQPRGRGPGGSTRINAMIWYPPRSCDIDTLVAHSGGNLDRQSLASSLDAVTSWVRPQPPRWLSDASRHYLRTTTPVIEAPHAFLRMGNRAGRVTAADLLAGATFDRGSVELMIAHVIRIVFNGDWAIGLEVRRDGDSSATVLSAEKGVILCGGTFASAAILMQGGIGPRDKLAELPIDIRVDSPDVGNHLADHLIMPVTFAVSGRQRFPTQPSVADLARWQIAGTGPLASNLAESGGIYQLPIGATHQQLPIGATHQLPAIIGATHHLPATGDEFQVHVTPTHYLTHPSESAVAAMTIGVNLCSPKSRGSVSIGPTDQVVPPIDQLVPPTIFGFGGRALRIDPGYLSDRSDLQAMIAAVRQGREIADDPELCAFISHEIVPGAARQSDEAIERSIARFAQTLYHPVGTCRLGTDATSVVDPAGAVRGTRRLYVIDGSILPTIPSVNPNATIMMLAHRLASGLID